MEVVVLNANGQVTLPAKERKKYGLGPGTKVRFVERKDGLLLQKARVVNESIFEELSRIADAKGITQKDVIRIARQVRRETFKEE